MIKVISFHRNAKVIDKSVSPEVHSEKPCMLTEKGFCDLFDVVKKNGAFKFDLLIALYI